MIATAANPTAQRPTTACDHCGLAVPAVLVEADKDSQFCCNGCRVAYDVIHGGGLDEYYRLRDQMGGERAAVPQSDGRYAAYDSEAFLAKHTQATGVGLQAIELRLEGVHCAACVWLVEKLPRLVPGVIEARLSLTSSSSRVVWDPQRTPLSAIAAKLDQLGYPPHPARNTTARDVRLTTERRRLVRMAVAGALAGNNMLIALALYAGVFSGMGAEHEGLFRWTSMAIGWLSLVWPGRVFFASAVASLRSRASSLDQPIALALGAGAIAGTFNVLTNRGDVYFDSLSLLVFLLLVGRFLQARQQRWAADAVGATLAVTPDVCRVVRDGRVIDEAVEALAVDDLVEVRSGDLFPADGVVRAGESAVDKSLLTGESAAVPVGPGAEVFSGAQNVGATLRVAVTAVGGETRIGRLQRLVEQGAGAKTPLVQFADRIARWFVLAMLGLGSVNFALWAWLVGVGAAIDSTVAMLIVACPCTLGLATPLTMAIAIGRASRRGLLVKSADVLDRLSRVTPSRPTGELYLDKTGTLTRNEMCVVAWRGDRTVSPLVAAAERESSHPLAAAIVGFCERQEWAAAEVLDRREHAGRGIVCRSGRGELRIGTLPWLRGEGVSTSRSLDDERRRLESRGITCVGVALDGETVALIGLSDTINADAAATLSRIAAGGWTPHLLSGDGAGAVAAVARQVGVDASHAHANATPEEKLETVRRAVDAAHSSGSVTMMVGDGVNDAAALAAADVGVAVSGGVEAALAAADVYASRPGVGWLLELTALARQTMRVARRNLGLSLAYNAAAITLAGLGMVTPLVAAVLMPLSSVTVLTLAITGLSRAAIAKNPATRDSPCP